MEWERVSTDQLEQMLLQRQQRIDHDRVAKLALLEELDRRQVYTADGSRNLSEWVATRLDVSRDTARSLVHTMRRSQHRPELREALASGEITLDRVEALSKISDDVGLLSHLDIGGIHREAARRARLTGEAESRTAEDNYLFLQYTLDQTWALLRGGLDGYSASVVDKTLTEAADQLPPLRDGTRGDRSWRRATALVGLCVSGESQPAQVTVFVDADEASASSGEAGVMIEAGPKTGVQALQAILCDAITEIQVKTADGRLMEYGRKTRTIPPALRRAIIHRDSGVCSADGCSSQYRLEVHHVIPWSQGGPTDPDNLITLCWYHHHMVIHQKNFQIYRHPQHGRIRFRKPGHDPPT